MFSNFLLQPSVALLEPFIVACGDDPKDDQNSWGNSCSPEDAVIAILTDLHNVRCCSNTEITDWTKKADCNVWTNTISPDCSSDKTYLEAKTICEDQGTNSRLCSAEELKCASGSDCGFDDTLIWTSTTAQVIDSDPNQQVKAYCGRKFACDESSVTASMGDLYGVRCCSDVDRSGDLWEKRSNSCPWGESNMFGTCFYKVTFDTAKAICEADNARLCSGSEIDSNCTRGSGCGHDINMVWTSDVV